MALAEYDPFGEEQPHDGRSRVLTLTPAPSIDRVYVVGGLRPGEVNRAQRIEAHVAGNGVNLARDLRAAGNEVVAVVPLNLESVIDLVDDVDLFRIVPVAHPTRVNAVIIGEDGVTTNINQAANPLSDLDWRALREALREEARLLQPDWLVVGGTIPSGWSRTGLMPGSIMEIAREMGARVCLDSPGPVLAEWLRMGFVPHLASPNVSELEEALGTPIATMGDTVDAAARLVDAGVDTVLVSLGAAGAVLVTAEHQMWARSEPAEVVNTTGAGDAALAGLVTRWRGKRDAVAIENALATAMRWGRAAVQNITPTITAENVEFARVEIEVPQRDLRIS